MPGVLGSLGYCCDCVWCGLMFCVCGTVVLGFLVWIWCNVLVGYIWVWWFCVVLVVWMLMWVICGVCVFGSVVLRFDFGLSFYCCAGGFGSLVVGLMVCKLVRLSS